MRLRRNRSSRTALEPEAAAARLRILAVSDEVDELLSADPRAVGRVDLLVSCGDLPFDYLARLGGLLDAPVVFVPGNHDPDVSGYRQSRSGLMLRAGLPTEPPWPAGALNADGRVVDVGGLRLAGLGGCVRYSEGPNQYTQRQQARRAWRVALAARWSQARHRRPVDVLLTHAPPRGVGDGEDPAHHGFTALIGLVSRLRPTLVLHGHVHPYGTGYHDRSLGSTLVCNVVGHRIFELELRDGHPSGLSRGRRPGGPASSEFRLSNGSAGRHGS